MHRQKSVCNGIYKRPPVIVQDAVGYLIRSMTGTFKVSVLLLTCLLVSVTDVPSLSRWFCCLVCSVRA